MATKTTVASVNQPVVQPGIVGVHIHREVETEAEACDPYAMGWDAGEDLDEPPPCPFIDGLSAKLWRQGFSARVDEYIAKVKSCGGLSADISA